MGRSRERGRAWHARYRVCGVGLLAALVAAAPSRAGSDDAKTPIKLAPGAPAHPTRAIVKMKRGMGALAFAAAADGHGVRAVGRIPRTEYELVELASPDRSVAQMVEELRASPMVELAEPDYQVFPTVIPNDADFGSLWGLDQPSDADIDAPEAWEVTEGEPQIVVAVVDTGVDLSHPDLTPNLWVNADEVANGIDDDANGYVDDLHGANCIRGDGNPRDDDGHGTHVSGTIAAVAGNGLGVAGVSPRVRLMPLRFLSRGGGFVSDAIECLNYALEMRQRGVEVRVVNNSWGGGGFSEALRDTIAALDDAAVLFVAAAGNDGADTDEVPHYPSSYELPNVVSVAATDELDQLASFSNHGARSVHLAAPGVDILSTWPRGDYRYLSGTSMAAPHVSGAAALIAAHLPALDPAGIRAVLLASGDAVPALAGRVASERRLNAAAALCSPGDLALEFFPRSFRVGVHRDVMLRASVRDCGTPVPGGRVRVTPSTGGPALSLEDDGRGADAAANDGVYTAWWRPGAAGPVELAAQALVPGATLLARTSGEVVDVTKYQIDADAPFDWVDATPGGQLRLRADDGAVRLALGFEFPFYGAVYRSALVSSNGYLTFGKSGSEYINRPIPSKQAPDGLIAPYWDDLLPGETGHVYWRRNGTRPDRTITIEWRDFGYYRAQGRVTFQVTLHERDGRIVFRYLDVESGSLARAAGRSATVGLQDPGTDFAELFGALEPTLHDRMAIEFSVDDSEVPARELPLFGRRLLLRDVEGRPGMRALAWSAVDPALVPPPVGGTSDPSRWGARLRLRNSSTGELFEAELPAVGWRAGARGYDFRGAGACRRVSLRGGTLRASCAGEALEFSLDEPAQDELAAELSLGSKTSFCSRFGDAAGGVMGRDHGIGFGTPETSGFFVGLAAPAPADCD